MITGVAIWAGAKAVGSGLLTFAKRVPWQVWLAIGLLIAAYQGVQGVNRALSASFKKGVIAGTKAENERLSREIWKLRAKAEAKNRVVAAKIRKITDEKAVRSNAVADDLRLRGPGKAGVRACPANPIASPGRSEPASGTGDVAGAQVPANDGYAVVPWGWIVERARTCDLNRQEVLSWRQQYAEQFKPAVAE